MYNNYTVFNKCFFFWMSLSYFDINNGSKFIVNYKIIVIVLLQVLYDYITSGRVYLWIYRAVHVAHA